MKTPPTRCLSNKIIVFNETPVCNHKSISRPQLCMGQVTLCKQVSLFVPMQVPLVTIKQENNSVSKGVSLSRCVTIITARNSRMAL